MALTASVSLPSSTMQIGKFQLAQLSISNSGASEVLISNAVPHIYPTSQASDAACMIPASSPITIPPNSPVPPSGSLVLTFPVVFQSGSGLSTNSVGCLVYGADGSLVEATPATVTVVDVNPYA